MVGNMRSRWRNFLTTDGEKPDRNRDSEFEERAKISRRADGHVGRRLEICFRRARTSHRRAISAATVMIRTEPHSVMQAINRQVAHYSMHIGQIVFAAKHMTAAKTGKWQSLSVPRGQSSQFTADVASGKKSQR